MEVMVTITPIFAIIILGWGSRKRGFITPEFLEPANKLVYYLSIPAMIFNSIAKSSFHEQFDGKVLSLTLIASTGIYAAAYGFTRLVTMEPARAGAFVQSSGHGNVGYIGIPIAFYLGGCDLEAAPAPCLRLDDVQPGSLVDQRLPACSDSSLLTNRYCCLCYDQADA